MVRFVYCAFIAELADNFGLLFDGWYEGSVHYISICATFRVAGQYQQTLIEFFSLLREDFMGAQKNLIFIREPLGCTKCSIRTSWCLFRTTVQSISDLYRGHPIQLSFVSRTSPSLRSISRTRCSESFMIP